MRIDGIDFSIEATKLTFQEFKDTFGRWFYRTDINKAYKLLHAHFGTKIKRAKSVRRKKITGKGDNVKKRRSTGHSEG